VLVPKLLVPDNATLPASASGEKRLHGSTQSSRILVKESTRAGLAPRKNLFAEAMLENSSTRPRRRARDFVVSATVQLLLLATLLLLPLYFTEAPDTHQLNPTLLVPIPPAAPPPPAASTRSIAPKRKVSPVAGKLLAPTVIPHRVAQLSEEPDASDLAPAILPGDGVHGGVPGGQPGGVIGGVLSGAVPPAPAAINSAPKRPVRVGQGVKAPRLILGPQPVYPILARQARISGAVVIDAVIDTQGNIVEMRTVSGHPILALAAMEALRHWKYEPTILGGEAIPVELLVTLTFVSKGPQA